MWGVVVSMWKIPPSGQPTLGKWRLKYQEKKITDPLHSWKLFGPYVQRKVPSGWKSRGGGTDFPLPLKQVTTNLMARNGTHFHLPILEVRIPEVEELAPRSFRDFWEHVAGPFQMLQVTHLRWRGARPAALSLRPAPLCHPPSPTFLPPF